MSQFYLNIVERIPADERRIILEENFIDKATAAFVLDSPMNYLFDVYAQYIDVAKEYQHFDCPKCRDYVLTKWREFKPYLQQLELNHAAG